MHENYKLLKKWGSKKEMMIWRKCNWLCMQKEWFEKKIGWANKVLNNQRGASFVEKKWMILIIFLERRKYGVFKKKKIRNTLVNKNFTTYRKDEVCFIRFSHVQYDYCC